MAGKPLVFGNRSILYAVDVLTKNTLLDFVVDLAARELGDEHCSDEEIVKWIEDRMETIHIHRNQRPVSLSSRLASFRRQNAAYLEKHPEAAASPQ